MGQRNHRRQPPVGDLRFEAPVPKRSWRGTLDVSEKKPECVQGSNPVRGNEDCLYLKVYTPMEPNTRNNLPVMVWIYGGAFFFGSTDFDDHSPDYLLDEDVIAVSFHYRVGIMGFMTTGDTVSPGNNGLRDQILALKWIKDNIRNFGGDPNRITLVGQSAGAASISYLLQTEETKGLFSGAIIQSGSSLCPWALSKTLPKVTKSIATTLKINGKTSGEIKAGLKSVDAELLQTTSMSAMNSELVSTNPSSGLVYAPVTEPDHDGAVVTGKSHEKLKNGQFHQIPIIVGYTSLEGMFDRLPALARGWLLKYDANPTLLIPESMKTTAGRNLGGAIKRRYFGILPIATASQRLMRFISDDQFERPILESIRLFSSKTPVYCYRFSYQGPLFGVTRRPQNGVGHTEDLGYIFDFGHKGSSQDYLARSRVVKLWTNFIKTGKSNAHKRNSSAKYRMAR
ncbi:hypothetical protein JTB14_009765 [Gonioctena quinquepunctata]|nr:hypothetical protein JTB14_009765 [Gonioctena quinquepunctata]